jgi:hypothetical protein
VTFDITARFETLVRFFEELVPVDDTTDKPAKVDVVLRVGSECPLLGAVFDVAAKVLDMTVLNNLFLTISSLGGSIQVELAIRLCR